MQNTEQRMQNTEWKKEEEKNVERSTLNIEL